MRADRPGVVNAHFFTQIGRAIYRRGGASAQRLALYLQANSHANMIGLYPLPLATIVSELPLKRPAVREAFAALADERFAYYDTISEVVWVVDMARTRLWLGPTDQLEMGDKRIAGVNACYATVPLNAFLGSFWDRYRGILHLTYAREHWDLGASVSREHADYGILAQNGAVLGSPFEGASKPLGSQVQIQEEQVQVQDVQEERAAASAPPPPSFFSNIRNTRQSTPFVEEETAAASTPPLPSQSSKTSKTSKTSTTSQSAPYRVVQKIAHLSLDLLGTRASFGDLTETIKCQCAQAQIPYNSDLVTRALRSALVQRTTRRGAR